MLCFLEFIEEGTFQTQMGFFIDWQMIELTKIILKEEKFKLKRLFTGKTVGYP